MVFEGGVSVERLGGRLALFSFGELFITPQLRGPAGRGLELLPAGPRGHSW